MRKEVPSTKDSLTQEEDSSFSLKRLLNPSYRLTTMGLTLNFRASRSGRRSRRRPF